jgi:type I restriction enzyme S subunit
LELKKLQTVGAQPNLSLQQVSDVLLKNPPLPEQQKIAAILTSVDEVIEKTQAQIDKLKDLKTAMMQELLTYGVGVDGKPHTEFKDSPVGRIPKGWEICFFKDIATSKPQKFNPIKETAAYKCIELEHLSQKTGQVIGSTPSQNIISIKNVFKVGDVLFSKLRPYLKKYAQPNFDGICSSEIWVMKPNKNIDSTFLFYIVQSEKFIESANKSCGTKMPRAELSTVLETIVAKPPFQEQLKIANTLGSIDSRIIMINKRLTKIKLNKKALMQDLLTGKVRVTVPSSHKAS